MYPQIADMGFDLCQQFHFKYMDNNKRDPLMKNKT